jgi:hypothetical protein
VTGQPYERPEFTNATTYTVTLTITVEGGKRRDTADRRARKVAERLANTAARIPGVLEISATAGWTSNGKVCWPQQVHFSQANIGRGTHDHPDKLDRYLDPIHELAKRSLAAANAAAEQRRNLDRKRRRNAGCHNTWSLINSDRQRCACVYCDPEDHYLAAQYVEHNGPNPFCTYRCVCGVAVPAAGQRCLSHRDVPIVVLDGDPASLQVLADLHCPQPARDAHTIPGQSHDPSAQPERTPAPVQCADTPGPELDL